MCPSPLNRCARHTHTHTLSGKGTQEGVDALSSCSSVLSNSANALVSCAAVRSFLAGVVQCLHNTLRKNCRSGVAVTPFAMLFGALDSSFKGAPNNYLDN